MNESGKNKKIEYLMEELSHVYCDTCVNMGSENVCDFCVRKNMGWGISKGTATRIVEELLNMD